MTTPQTQKKILITIIALLVIANAVTLYMLVQKPQGKAKSGKRGEMAAYLSNTVKYTDDQIANYKSLREQHEKEAEKLFSDIRKQKQQRLQQVAQNNFNDSSLLVHADSMAAIDRNVELLMMRHLKNVRNIGTEQQRVVFDSTFVKHLAERQKSKKAARQ